MRYRFILLATMLSCVVLCADSIILSAHVFPYTLTASAPVVLSTTDSETWSDGFGLYLDEDGCASAYVAGTNGFVILRGSFLPIEQWSHLKLQINPHEASFFIDDVLQNCAKICFVGEPNSNLIIADDGYVCFDGEVKLDKIQLDSLANFDYNDSAMNREKETKSIKESCNKSDISKTKEMPPNAQTSLKEALLQSHISVKEVSTKNEVDISQTPLFVLHRCLE